MKRAVRIFRDDFIGHIAPPATASSDGSPWVKAVTAAGSPTVQTVDEEPTSIGLTMEATNEIQNLTLYFGDVLCFLAEKLKYYYTRLKLPAALDATSEAWWGLTDDRDDDRDTIARAAIFAVDGDNDVFVESDDASTNNDDKSTGLTLVDTYKEFVIDFTQGLADVRYEMSDANGYLTRVAKTTKFDLSGLETKFLQPNFTIHKTADTNVDALTIDVVEVEFKV